MLKTVKTNRDKKQTKRIKENKENKEPRDQSPVFANQKSNIIPHITNFDSNNINSMIEKAPINPKMKQSQRSIMKKSYISNNII